MIHLKELAGGMYEILIALSVIVFFAIVHATSQLKVHRDNGMEFDRVDFIVLFIIGCGSGGLFGLGALWIWDDNLITIILFSAVGAVSGLVGLNRFASMMLDVLTNSTKKK